MEGIFPQLPVSALEDFELVLAVEPVELDEHAATATSSAALPRPTINLAIPRLIQISL
jgi:hypothetical protein